MAQWVIPVEGKTGVPLALAPRYDTPERLRSVEGENDWHHAMPRRRFGNLTSVSAAALKGARVQFSDYDEHRTYHYYFDDYFDTKWSVPKTNLDRFGKVVLLGAGYIPELAIRSRKSGPEYVRLGARQREFMWSRGIVRVENTTAMFEFIKSMVLEQPLDIECTAAQEFVFSADEQLRMQRGNELLMAAADQATEQVKRTYTEAYIGRLIEPGLPEHPREFILEAPQLLGTEKRKRTTRTALRKRMASELGVTLPDVA